MYGGGSQIIKYTALVPQRSFKIKNFEINKIIPKS